MCNRGWQSQISEAPLLRFFFIWGSAFDTTHNSFTHHKCDHSCHYWWLCGKTLNLHIIWIIIRHTIKEITFPRYNNTFCTRVTSVVNVVWCSWFIRELEEIRVIANILQFHSLCPVSALCLAPARVPSCAPECVYIPEADTHYGWPQKTHFKIHLNDERACEPAMHVFSSENLKGQTSWNKLFCEWLSMQQTYSGRGFPALCHFFWVMLLDISLRLRWQLSIHFLQRSATRSCTALIIVLSVSELAAMQTTWITLHQ